MQYDFQPWWHILFNSSQWKFKIKKDLTKINLYTGITPYDKEHFHILFGRFECVSELNNNSL